MGRKTKEQKEVEDRNKKFGKVQALLTTVFEEGEMFEQEDVLLQLGFQVCLDCEQIGFGLRECAVCNDFFCDECATGHAYEETEL